MEWTIIRTAKESKEALVQVEVVLDLSPTSQHLLRLVVVAKAPIIWVVALEAVEMISSSHKSIRTKHLAQWWAVEGNREVQEFQVYTDSQWITTLRELLVSTVVHLTRLQVKIQRADKEAIATNQDHSIQMSSTYPSMVKEGLEEALEAV